MMLTPYPAAPAPRAYFAGELEYLAAWDLQRRLHAARAAGAVGDTLLLCSHPDTITLGVKGGDAHFTAPEDWIRARGYAVHRVDRGGDVTYHGPGQLVGYLIFHLACTGGDIGVFLRRMEETIIRYAATHGIAAARREGMRGVWVGNNKLCAMGIKVSRNVVYHGFALNVTTDLARFGVIVPCGLAGTGVTSIARETGAAPDLATAAAGVAAIAAEIFGLPFGAMEHAVPDAPEMPEPRGDNSITSDRNPWAGKRSITIAH